MPKTKETKFFFLKKKNIKRQTRKRENKKTRKQDNKITRKQENKKQEHFFLKKELFFTCTLCSVKQHA